MAVWQFITAAWMAQRGHLFPWVPVAMACGIVTYFTLRIEPPPLAYMWLGVAVA